MFATGLPPSCIIPTLEVVWNSKSYHQWMYTVKKGGALINTAMTKASPAMKTAYQYAKNHAKQGIKEVRSKLKHKETDYEYGTCHSGLEQYSQIDIMHNSKRLNTDKRRLAQNIITKFI
uniref:DENN domain-containing protein 1B n=1 Tax=Sphaerodactylus townsendi TaxID=933632 RepID=A0ACB8F362_9SAUR